jgi:hypothetical protein
VFHVANYASPTQRDIAKFYVQGKTKEEILKIYMVDDNQIEMGVVKHETKLKINHFFKVLKGARKAYVENPRSRICFEFLITQTSKCTLVNITSCKKILKALIDAGWSIEKETEGLQLKDKYESKSTVPYVKT